MPVPEVKKNPPSIRNGTLVIIVVLLLLVAAAAMLVVRGVVVLVIDKMAVDVFARVVLESQLLKVPVGSSAEAKGY